MTQKPYKCRVEYLQSSGTQYIDLGITSKSTMRAKAKFNLANVSAQAIFGSATTSPAGDGVFLGTASTGVVYCNNTMTPISPSLTLVANTNYEFDMSLTTVSINGVNYTASTTTDNNYNMLLFARILAGSVDRNISGKIYYFKLYDNGVLVRDMIPVLDNSGRPAMYDQVSGQLFYNQGTGEFTYGRQIIPVEYLESTGTQYIDTGISTAEGICTEAKFKINTITSSNQAVFGKVGVTSGSTTRYFFGIQSSSSGLFYYAFNDIYQTNKQQDTNIHTVLFDSVNNILKIDDNSWALSGDLRTNSETIYLFGAHYENSNNNPMSGRIYYTKIWNNNTLVRDFIPCIDENLTPFMFDKVNGTVYLNAGTGQFKVGPNVEKFWGGKKLRRKLALALATLKKKRPYYCEVEYLQSTGTQYIDTGIILQNTAKIEIIWSKAQFTNYYEFLMGSRSTNSSTDSFALLINDLNKFGYDFSDTTGEARNSFSISVNTVYKTEVYYQNGLLQYVKNNGTNASVIVSKTKAECPYSLYLFNLNNGGIKSAFPGSYKIYRMRIDGVCDFIPVLDWNMTPCMYDRVTDQLFYNQGTGDFIAGREIHRVEHIETDGTSYINTGYIPSGSTETEITTMLKDQTTSRFMFGCRTTQSTNTYACLAHNSNRIGYRVGDGGYLYSNGYNELNTKHTYKIANGVFYRDDVVINTACQSASVSPNSPLALLTINTNNVLDGTQSFIGNLYSCTIKENNTLVRDYIPAIDENGVGFMFDRVSHTIYDNAGTGAFKYPAREVEYLQSDGARAIGTDVTIDDTCGYDIKWMALNADDRIIMGTKGSGDSRWVLSGSNNPYVNISWNTSFGGTGLGLNKIQTAQMNYFNDRKRILNDTPLTDITQTLSANASTYSVGIFGGYWGASQISLYSTCRIYYAKISKGTEIIRDFIPMVKDGSPCLFDKIGGLYYFGTGTGSFTTGKIVEPEYE